MVEMQKVGAAHRVPYVRALRIAWPRDKRVQRIRRMVSGDVQRRTA